MYIVMYIICINVYNNNVHSNLYINMYTFFVIFEGKGNKSTIVKTEIEISFFNINLYYIVPFACSP